METLLLAAIWSLKFLIGLFLGAWTAYALYEFGYRLVTGHYPKRMPHMNLPDIGKLVYQEDLERILAFYGEHAMYKRIAEDPPMSIFSSDGCSCWPDSFGKYIQLYECCFLHDIPYWFGYPKFYVRGWRDRLIADVKLFGRVLLTNGWKSFPIAVVMFIGVRIGGIWWIGIRNAHWGFGRRRG